MLPFLAPIISFFGSVWQKNKALTIAVGTGLLFLLLFLQQCKSTKTLKKKLAVAEHNINVLNDTLRITKDKAGKDEANKLAFLTDKLSHLEDLNKDLYNEIKNIKGKVGTIIKGDIKIVHDTITLETASTVTDSTVRVDFDYSKTYSPGNTKSLKGYTVYDLLKKKSYAELTKDSISMRFTTGIKNLDKGKPEIFLKSDYPDFQVTELEGAVIDPALFSSKKSTPLITPGISIGWVPATYSIKSGKIKFGLDQVAVTIGLNINILKLIKPRL